MSSTDEELRELERRFQKEPNDQRLCQRLATAFQRQGRLSEAIDTLLRGGLFRKDNLCAQSLGEELRGLQRDTLRGLEGLDLFHGFFNVKERLDWRFRGPDDSAMENFPEPILGIGDLGSEECAQLRKDSQAHLWLHSLDLNMPRVGLETLNWIDRLPFLRCLSLQLRDFEREQSFVFANGSSLRSLELECRDATAFFNSVEESPLKGTLTKLVIVGRVDKAVISFDHFEKLESLIFRAQIAEENPATISFPKSLTCLELANLQLGNSQTIRGLAELENLKELRLGFVPDLAEASTFFEGLTSLTTLHSTNVLNEGLSLLPCPEKLKFLSFQIGSFDESVGEALERFPNLKELTIEVDRYQFDPRILESGVGPFTERLRQRLRLKDELSVEIIA